MIILKMFEVSAHAIRLPANSGVARVYAAPSPYPEPTFFASECQKNLTNFFMETPFFRPATDLLAQKMFSTKNISHPYKF